MPDDQTKTAQEERAARLQAAIDELDQPSTRVGATPRRRRTLREWVEQRGEELRRKTGKVSDTPPDEAS